MIRVIRKLLDSMRDSIREYNNGWETARRAHNGGAYDSRYLEELIYFAAANRPPQYVKGWLDYVDYVKGV